MKKAVPELFLDYEWVGSAGPGVGGGKAQPIYRMKRLDGEVVGYTGGSGYTPAAPSRAEEASKELAKKVESKFNRKEFSWRKIFHALQSPIGTNTQGDFFMEVPFTPTPMRMYTDHRVMGAVVLPGVSHIALFATTGMVGYGSAMPGAREDDHAVVKEVLFERPYVVHAGLEIIHSEGAGGGAFGSPGLEMTYCRCSSVSRERGTKGGF